MAIYHFGPFSLHEEARELRKDDTVVPIEPRVYDLLNFLIANRDRAISKDDLIASVWPTQVITDAALARAIMKTRKAIRLDDEAWQPIKTVQGFGYHFVAPVQTADHQAPDSLSEHQPEHPARHSSTSELTPQRRLFGAAAWTMGVVILVVIGAIAYHLMGDQNSSAQDSRVAVLPAQITDSNTGKDWLRLGLMELAAEYLRAQGLQVVDGKEVYQLAQASGWNDETLELASMAELAQRAFGNTHLVSLTLVPGTEDNASLQVRMLTHGGGIVNHQIFGEEPTALAVRAGEHIAKQLNVNAVQPTTNAYLVSDDAFVNEAFSRAQEAYITGNCGDVKNLMRIVVDQLPDAFRPQHVMANCDRVLGDLAAAENALLRLIEKQQALENLRNVADAHNSLGVVYDIGGQHDKASDHYTKGLALSQQVGAHDVRAKLLINTATLQRYEDPERALETLNRAVSAYEEAGQPVSGYYYSTLGNIFTDTAQQEAACDAYLKAIDRFEAVGNQRMIAIAHGNLFLAFSRRNDYETAEWHIHEAIRIREEIGDQVGLGRNLTSLAQLLRNKGELEEALVAARSSHEIANRSDNKRGVADANIHLSIILGELGNFDEAISSAAMALEQYRDLGDRQRTVQSKIQLADMLKESGQLESARQAADEALADARDWDKSDQLILRALLQRSNIAAEIEEEELLYEQLVLEAREIASSNPNLHLNLTGINRSLARFYTGIGSFDKAEPIVGWLAANDIDSWQSDLVRGRFHILTGSDELGLRLIASARAAAGDGWQPDHEALYGQYLQTHSSN